MTTTATNGPDVVVDFFDEPVSPDEVAATVCPDWCIDHFYDGVGANGRAVMHYPPRFGRVRGAVYATRIDGTPVRDVDGVLVMEVEEAFLNAVELRELARDALAAAEWLESVR
jgi:hypothetical protein